MAGERYWHFFLPGPTRTSGFTNPRQGGTGPRNPARDRETHSQHLEERLQQAWSGAEALRAQAGVERHGAYIEFVSDPGFDLMVQSLESVRSGIRLANIRTDGEGQQKQTFATVYVPTTQRGVFLRKIRAYANENTSGRVPQPKN